MKPLKTACGSCGCPLYLCLAVWLSFMSTLGLTLIGVAWMIPWSLIDQIEDGVFSSARYTSRQESVPDDWSSWLLHLGEMFSAYRKAMIALFPICGILNLFLSVFGLVAIALHSKKLTRFLFWFTWGNMVKDVVVISFMVMAYATHGVVDAITASLLFVVPLVFDPYISWVVWSFWMAVSKGWTGIHYFDYADGNDLGDDDRTRLKASGATQGVKDTHKVMNADNLIDDDDASTVVADFSP